ncbi:MAG: hypothetical protein P8O16_09550 [Algoriphagus sp.]|uniref:hypothetical protein n=1 Tax=Algoriphagus sp. TaxID=1872435 RepID=UPI00263183D8|nr:hypothetical protein [Algoriphagus sp.]MDG1277513.1 hypothetical protein [Algoriphagus sp.]
MKKLLSLSMILLSWIISLTAVLFFPVQTKSHTQQTSIYTHIDLNGNNQISEGIELIEVPDFKVDQKLFCNFIEELGIDFPKVVKSHSFKFSSIKGIPLFDVKRLFIHFFYPW